MLYFLDKKEIIIKKLWDNIIVFVGFNVIFRWILIFKK